ncbi:excalibur calcium-binding domain-containing protein [Mesorhizobium sp. M8A.F.Ca.ET.161.01.1.1]|nr:excalibur calcium-binding domain-containing protein [bacterium M00.F.Ca.ET.205.01.1.1]TGT92128.1 excalibur calcium-binding domain-containing protein [Mesorhizobium sp. M8A.F.Ca.ET.161.01.1.1]TGU53717.1 excalibur calcium-binding domain-containing protein [bacterium M00.F.Ca.ET.152.01.1.1]TGV37216.1 excalibur calcium-binding domain-containing protein [Mesorhizobium sp. M00.F.Ca.ET.186.01.1.1]TGV45154.1 excalibur calcium-binding domain-containing protein [Mesorhizobium sp. M8A.F.Ca.ET.142.01.1.
MPGISSPSPWNSSWLLTVTSIKRISFSRTAQSWSCQPRLTCSQISSCGEAQWYLENCSWGGKLDRDNHGIPCESLC